MLRYDSDERHFARSVPPVPVEARLPPGRTAGSSAPAGTPETGSFCSSVWDAGGRPAEATFAQHTWAEGCGWREIERVGPAPVAYVAAGLRLTLRSYNRGP